MIENEQHITSIVLLATGEYSDYSNAPFRVLKPFTMRAAAEEFRSQWKATNNWHDTPSPNEFIEWLNAAGYIEDLPVYEVHVGGYGDMRFENADMLDVEFAPSASPADQGEGPRVRFEQWYGNQGNCLDRDGDHYIRGDVQNDWEVWKAAMGADHGEVSEDDRLREMVRAVVALDNHEDMRDAARYRWLKAHWGARTPILNGLKPAGASDAAFDASIDAAMSASKEGA